MNPRLIFPLLLLLCSPVVRANMANPIRAGDAVGEPSVALDSLHVQAETLRIDLRPLERHDDAAVEAVYRVRNAGRGRRVDLVFVAAGMADRGDSSFVVELDGLEIPARRLDSMALPEAWRMPETTPALADDAPMRYEVRTDGGPGTLVRGASGAPAGLLFTLDLSTGVHTIRVRYRAGATANHKSEPCVRWQLAYILAPARQWASFGTLDAVVLLPAGWEAAASPAMKRAGDSLVARFTGIPADAIAISARLAPPSAFMLFIADEAPLWVAGLAGAALCALAGRRIGRWRAARGRSVYITILVSVVMGVWCVLLLFAAMSLADTLVGNAIGNQRAHGAGYGRALGLFIFGIPLALLMGAIITLIADARAHRRAVKG